MNDRRCKLGRINELTAKDWFQAYIGIGDLPTGYHWFLVNAPETLIGAEQSYQVTVAGQSQALIGKRKERER